MRKLLIAFAALALCSCTVSEPKDVVLNTLREASESGRPLVGHQDSYYYGLTWENTENTRYGLPQPPSDYFKAYGVYPDILGSDLGHIELGDGKNIDGVPFDLIRECVIFQDAQGWINTISWHPRNPVTGSDAWDNSRKDVVASIIPGGCLHEIFVDRYLKPAVEFLLSLRREDGTLIPLIFRPWHEHTGSWFWWGRDNCTTEEYLALWKMTREYFDAAGLDNLLWGYSPDKTGIETYMERYPGDEYVDLFGIDAYIFEIPELTREQFREYYRGKLHEWFTYTSSLAREHGKIFAVTETGFESIPDPYWYTEILMPALEGTCAAYCLFWRTAWNKAGHYYIPYPGHEGVENFRKAFKVGE